MLMLESGKIYYPLVEQIFAISYYCKLNRKQQWFCSMFDASKCLLCVSGAVLHVRCIKVSVVCFRSSASCSMHQSVCCVFQE